MQKLILINNDDSGLRNMVMDSAHKIFAPSTYECGLCNFTYRTFTENDVWKKFRKETDLKMLFLHKDEFLTAYKSKFSHKFTFPIVLIETKYGLEVLVKTEELNGMTEDKELIRTLQART